MCQAQANASADIFPLDLKRPSCPSERYLLTGPFASLALRRAELRSLRTRVGRAVRPPE